MLNNSKRHSELQHSMEILSTPKGYYEFQQILNISWNYVSVIGFIHQSSNKLFIITDASDESIKPLFCIRLGKHLIAVDETLKTWCYLGDSILYMRPQTAPNGFQVTITDKVLLYFAIENWLANGNELFFHHDSESLARSWRDGIVCKYSDHMRILQMLSPSIKRSKYL